MSCHLQIVTVTHFFLSKLDAFYFSFLPNCAGWDFSPILNASGESGHPCLVPDLRGNAFSFSPLTNVSCGFVVSALYSVKVCSLYAHFLKSFFYHIWMLNFIKNFSYIS